MGRNLGLQKNYFIQGNNISSFFIYLFIWIAGFDRRSKGISSNRNDWKQGEDKTEVVHVQRRKEW